MCGIAGFAGEDEGKISRMTNAILHRGPDGHAMYVGNGASMCHARLAILDPRAIGNQPMWNEDKTSVIVFNGEIFNYKELREAEGFRCKTDTDTEVLLKLFDRYGMSFIERLRGMFAFGIYDVQKREWHLARDPNGINPLFVAYPDDTLHFASETRALMKAFKEKPEIDEDVLSLYMRLQYVPGEKTLCQGIFSLPPGTVLSWRMGEEEKRRRVIPKDPLPEFPTKSAFKERFPAIMDRAVREHLLSDRPVGLALSGGMDSSIVLHHMCANTPNPVKTFTIRFEATKEEGAERFNKDADLAALTAKHYGTDHHEILLTAELCKTLYKDAARALDQPNADSVAMAQFALTREARKDVTVLLTGAGGDELFGGYPRYRIAHILDAFHDVPASLRSFAGTLFGYPSDVLKLSPGAALAERLLARPADELTPLVKRYWFKPQVTTKLFEERFEKLEVPDPVRGMMEFDRGLWLVDESLRLCDGVGLGNGIECRIPFLDRTIIAASFATPSHWHVTMRRTKALLKDTYRPLLPGHLFSLHKASFYPPLAKWIRREMSPLIEEMLEDKRIQEYFDTDALRLLYEKHKRKEIYALHTLSSVLQLKCWFETVYDAPNA